MSYVPCRQPTATGRPDTTKSPPKSPLSDETIKICLTRAQLAPFGSPAASVRRNARDERDLPMSKVPGPHGPMLTEEVIALAARRCPRFVPHEVLAHTDKSLLRTGVYAGEAAVAKLLTDTAPSWRTRFTAEVRTYQVFVAHPPPVRVPRLLAADAEVGMLMLEQVSGAPANNERHPATPLARPVAAVMAATSGALAAWEPPAGAFSPVFDYPQRFSRYGPHGYGLLTPVDVERLTALYGELTDAGKTAWEFAHGDTLSSNFLLTDDGCELIDWEFAGLYLPGFDRAMLWILLHNDPATRAQLLLPAVTGGWHRQAAWWVNATAAVAREIRMHQGLPATSQRAHRPAALTEDMATVRTQLARLAHAIGHP